MEMTVRVLDTLEAYTNEQLDVLTEESGVFFCRQWLRMLDAVDLDSVLGGTVHKRYIVVLSEQRPVALCPFLVTSSDSIYAFYSFDKFFFKAWQDELLQLNPDKARFIRWVAGAVSMYRRFACATGASTRGWVLGVSPTSYQFEIATAPMPANAQAAVQAKVIESLEEIASEEDMPLCLLGVRDEQQSLRDALSSRGFRELFLMFDSVLPLEVASFDDYLKLFPSDARRRFKREIQQAEAAGVRFQNATDVRDVSVDLHTLYEATYAKYGQERFRHDPAFWQTLESHVGPHLSIVLASHGDRPVGFSALLHKGKDLHFWRVGRSNDAELADVPLYFNLAVYEPIKRALEAGATRLWLGPGSWEAKRRRGAQAHACYSYIRFPRRWPRSVLTPYLSTFSRISRMEQTAALGGN